MTLGQIAFEAFNASLGIPLDFEPAGLSGWEAAAQAVRAAVLEEAAKVCDDRWPDRVDDPILYPAFDEADACAQAIRGLK